RRGARCARRLPRVATPRRFRARRRRQAGAVARSSVGRCALREARGEARRRRDAPPRPRRCVMGGSLLGSSNTFEGIQDVIARFYAGERKSLEALDDGVTWRVSSPKRGVFPDVIVRLKRGRYRFEKT